jgi:hypothetical protein
VNRSGKGNHWALPLWLFAMDVVALLGGFGSRAYLWCVERASDCTDWGTPDELPAENERPF